MNCNLRIIFHFLIEFSPLFSHKNKIEANVAQLKAIDLQSNAIEVNRISQIKAQRNNAIALFQELEQYRPILENQDNIKLFFLKKFAHVHFL